MAHYAFLDSNNKVTRVIVGKDENEDGIDWEQWYGNFEGATCKRTSYNTHGGVHQNGGTPFRYNYAGIGFTFDETFGTNGAFIPPQPYPSWVLNTNTARWESPVPHPEDDSATNEYRWDETTTSWVNISND